MAIKYIKEILPTNKNDPLFVAVSMGVDSLAAYFFLKSKGYTNLIALHFNHKLRAQNDQMERMLVKLNIQYKIGYGSNLKSEVDCRNARINFFNESANGFSLVTAHHLNDYVENYLMNCLRGQPNYKPMSLFTQFDRCKVLHPFLVTQKKDFIEFVNVWKNGYLKEFVVEDETNSIIKGSRRNWIRQSLVPSMVEQKISLNKYCLSLIQDDIDQLQDQTGV